MKDIDGSVFNEPLPRHQFDFDAFVYSGLDTIAIGSFVPRADFFQYLGRKCAIPKGEAVKVIRDMVSEGYLENTKRGLFLKIAIPNSNKQAF